MFVDKKGLFRYFDKLRNELKNDRGEFGRGMLSMLDTLSTYFKCIDESEKIKGENIVVEINKEIATILTYMPYIRYCQLIVNVLGSDPFYVTDEMALKKLKEYREDIERKNGK